MIFVVVGTLVVSHGEALQLVRVPLLTVDVLLLALVVLNDRLPSLAQHHVAPAPTQRLGLVCLCLLSLVFCPSVLKPDFHLKLFIVITFYINLINNSDWSSVWRNLRNCPGFSPPVRDMYHCLIALADGN